MKKVFLVFIIFFVLFSLIQFSSENLAGVDGYYHIKNAFLLRTEGWFKSFPWLQATIWKDSFADFHFLFHIFLIPFTLGNLIWGAKLAAAILAAAVFAIFYWLLKKNQVKYSFLWTIILFCSSAGFIFRISMPKAQSLSLIFLFLGLYLISQRKYLLLAILSFLYVWAYGGFLILFILAFIYTLAVFIQTKKIDFKLISSCAGGLIAGLIINPYFPNNLSYLYIQLFRAGIFHSIPVGAEWYPTEFLDFARLNFLALFLFLIATAFIIINRINNFSIKSKTDSLTTSLFITSVFFLSLTIMANRFVEYWVPFAILFAAFVFSRQIISNWPPATVANLWPRKLTKFFVFSCLTIVIAGLATFNVRVTTANIDQGFSFDKYQSAALWLKENTPQNSVVFNSSWGDFPQLFFYNHHNYYLVGLDPTFTYFYDQQLYWLWQNMTKEGIVCGQQSCDKISSQSVYQIIKDKFKSDYVLVNEKHSKFRKILENDEKFKKVFEQETGQGKTTIFQLL